MRRSSSFRVDVVRSPERRNSIEAVVLHQLKPARSSRVLTVFAAGFLCLDGILLILAGSWARRIGLVAWGIVFLIGAMGVGLYWRHHTKRLAALREALEMEAMQLSQFRADLDESADG